MIEISESVSVVYEAFGENLRDVALKRRDEWGEVEISKIKSLKKKVLMKIRSCKEKRTHAHDCVDSTFFSLEIPNRFKKFDFSGHLTMFRGFVLAFIHASDCVLLQIYTYKVSKLVFDLCLWWKTNRMNYLPLDWISTKFNSCPSSVWGLLSGRHQNPKL